MAYFDNNATAPLKDTAYERMVNILKETGNASAVHTNGRAMRKHIEDARAEVAVLIGCEPEDIIFTSGGTESIVTAMSLFRGEPTVISSIEHSAVYANAPDAPQIPVSADGVMDVAAAESIIKQHRPKMISIIMASNETGVIQPVRAIADIAHAHDCLVHVDAVQSAGKIPIIWDEVGADYMSISAHKIGGPQGIGALIKAAGKPVPKLMTGGSQERRQRGGTENVAGIAGFGAAAIKTHKDMHHLEATRAMRDEIEAHILSTSNTVKIWGRGAARVPNTIMLTLAGVPSETQVMIMDLCGVAVGSGAACSSGSMKPSRVLMAMGCPEEEAKCCMRVSLGWANTAEDVAAFKTAWSDMISKLRHKMQSPC